MRLPSFVQLALLCFALALVGASASPFQRRDAKRRQLSIPALAAPNGWKASWTSRRRVSTGASSGYLGGATIDRTASAVNQGHLTACLNQCASNSRCGFVNLVKLQSSSAGSVVCYLYQRYQASSKATYSTVPQRQGGSVSYSYGVRSQCMPTNGRGLTCKPQAVSVSVPVPTTTTPTPTPTPTSTTVQTTSTTTTTPVPSTTGLPLPVYQLSQSNRGANFYSNNNWDFWNLPDPTHGTVQYVDYDTAVAGSLIGINANNQAFARASNQDLPLGQNRPSVRFQSKQAWDAALIVLDVAKVPIGCAVWPALWTVAGNTWPQNGEIDIFEGIGYTHGGTYRNLMSVHMNQTAVLTSSTKSYTGSLKSGDCMTNYGLGNTGCSFYDSNVNGPSWGQAFNNAGGGVWVALWGRNMGVRIWFWGRQSNKMPAELRNPQSSASSLDPSTWGTPMANFQQPVIDQYLNQQNIVLDITMNGDWAGNVPMDNVSQCGTNRTTALAAGSNFNDAQFVLNGIDVYT